jgi:hypothetical protein
MAGKEGTMFHDTHKSMGQTNKASRWLRSNLNWWEASPRNPSKTTRGYSRKRTTSRRKKL